MLRLTTALTCVALIAGAAAQADAATLVGRAVLPAATFAPGPTSGQFISGANGVSVPFANKQTVQGFSGVVPGPVPGTFDFIIDNGFGAKANSSDSLLRVFSLRPNFLNGTVKPVDFRTGAGTTFDKTNWFITLKDAVSSRIGFTAVYQQTNYPNGLQNIPVDPAIKSGRLLTGSDFDVEGIVRAPDGSYYFGEEFGPFIFHTDRTGKLLSTPVPAPNTAAVGTNPLVQSPDYPTPVAGSKLPPVSGTANAQRSGGFEGFTINPDGSKIYTLLEKSLTGDAKTQRRIINVFDTASNKFLTNEWFAYKVGDPDTNNNAGIDPTANSIGDMNMINDHQILVIERDQNAGASAKFKRVYLADLSVVDADGYVKKTLVADLMNLADPNNRGGNGTTNGVFTFPFITIEDVIAVDRQTILVANDNNFPFSSGRTPGLPDDNEIILVRLDQPLDVVCGAANAVPCQPK